MPNILNRESVEDILSFYGWNVHNQGSNLIRFISHPEIENRRNYFVMYSTKITCMYQGSKVPEISEVVYEQLNIDKLTYWIEKLIKEG